MLDVTRYSTPAPAPRAVFDHLPEREGLVRWVSRAPDGTPKATTFGDFARQIRRAALYLRSLGLSSGDRAAIFAPNRVEWMSAALAIQSAGGVMVPIYPASLGPQAGYVIGHSDARVVFVDTEALLRRLLSVWAELGSVMQLVVLDDALDLDRIVTSHVADHPGVPIADLRARILPWSVALRAGAALDEEDPTVFDRMLAGVSLDQPGVMLYTSGTTGHPKGVPLTHANVAQNGIDWFACNAPLLAEGMVDILWLPMSHAFGFGEGCIGNTLGWTTYLESPQTALAKLPEHRPDVFMSVPAYWEKLAQQAMAEPTPEARKAKLREVTGGRLSFCLSGGAGLKREVKELFHSIGVLLIEGYGLSECSPTLTLNRPDDFRFDSVGKPLPSVEIKLAEDGEILAKGPNIFAGYHKDPDATRETFTEDGWFKTGDVGRFTEDGFLQIVDRKKEILVTSGGKNIPPVNIELRFADEPLIERLVVYGDGRKYLVAGVWLSPGVPNDETTRRRLEAIVGRENAALASCEKIKAFGVMTEPLTVEAGHLTSTLKLRRKHVYAAFRDAFEALYEERAP